MDDLLTKKPHLKLGIVSGRSYGKEIDSSLKKHQGDKQIKPLFSGQFLEAQLGMFLKKRIDYTLGLPEEVGFPSRNNKKIAYLNILESRKMFSNPWFFACPKNDWKNQSISN